MRTLLNLLCLLLLLLLGPEHRWCEDPIESALFIIIIIIIRAQASKAQGPIDFLRIIRAQASKAQGPLVLLRIIIFFFFFFFFQPSRGF